ncbi:MAG: hypothetical protein AAF662_03390 [Pseudomonadota bacterium]
MKNLIGYLWTINHVDRDIEFLADVGDKFGFLRREDDDDRLVAYTYGESGKIKKSIGSAVLWDYETIGFAGQSRAIARGLLPQHQPDGHQHYTVVVYPDFHINDEIVGYVLDATEAETPTDRLLEDLERRYNPQRLSVLSHGGRYHSGGGG